MRGRGRVDVRDSAAEMLNEFSGRDSRFDTGAPDFYFDDTFSETFVSDHDLEGSANEVGSPAASNHEMHLRTTQKRYGKFHAVEVIANELARSYGLERPEIGIIGWGSTEGVIREAVQMAVDKGYSVGALHPKILYPQPIAKLKPFIEGAKAIIIPEVNFTGQFATLLRKRFAYDFIQLNKCIGLPFSPKEIFDKIEEVANDVRRDQRVHAENV